MKILKLAALAAIAINGKETELAALVKPEVADLINDGYVTATPTTELGTAPTVTYSLTEKGAKLVTLLEASSDYFEAHQDLKEGAAEAFAAVKEDTNKIIHEGKKRFNNMLDYLKIPLGEK